MASENIIDIKSLYKKYIDKNVLDNVSLSIKKGEIFGLIGGNGVGKTTLIKVIIDLHKADKGDVKIFGIDSTNRKSRNNISYLPEKFHPPYYLTGHEFLKLSMGYIDKKYDKGQASYYAQELGLELKALDNRIVKYSKGMAQKLGLIVTFLSQSELLILDEPMSGLDPNVRLRFKNLLRNYAREGNTIFFSSHILSDIDEICDRVGIINDSKIQFSGTSEECKSHYKVDSLEKAFLSIMQ